MADLTADDVKRLRDLLARSTPAPWTCERFGFVGAPVGKNGAVRQVASVLGDAPMYCDVTRTADEIREANTELIVQAVNVAPALLEAWEEREELRKWNRGAQSALDEKRDLLKTVVDVFEVVEKERDALAAKLAEIGANAETFRASMYALEETVGARTRERDAALAKLAEVEKERDELARLKRMGRDASLARLAEAEKELHALKERRFPVHSDGRPAGCPQSVPWHLIAPFEAMAQKNHDQSLERLAERGGLSAGELRCVVEGLHLRSLKHDKEAEKEHAAWLIAWLDAQSQPVRDRDAAVAEAKRLREALEDIGRSIDWDANPTAARLFRRALAEEKK